MFSFNPIALRQAKIVYNFGQFECNRVKLGVQIKTVPLQLCSFTAYMNSDSFSLFDKSEISLAKLSLNPKIKF